eukprot:gene9777-10812_t
MVISSTVYDAGGGAGVERLNFESISSSQMQMYRRTIGNLSADMERNAAQELRQLQISEPLVRIVVQVRREDFPTIKGGIEVTYYPSAAQQVWTKFLSDICKTLKIEFVECVLERGDKAPISRILRLRDGGDYLVRQRENSAVLEVLNSGETPIDSSWIITDRIVSAKKELERSFQSLPEVHRRIKQLITRRLTGAAERFTAQRILAAEQPIDVINAICLLYASDKQIDAEELSLLALSTRYGEIDAFRDKIDIISLHRLGLETLNRFAVQGNGKKVVNQSLQYILKIMEQLPEEIDLVTLGLRLLSDLLPFLSSSREIILKKIVEAIKRYTPQGPPRHGKGLQTLAADAAALTQSSSATLSASFYAVPKRHSGMRTGTIMELKRYDGQFATDEEKRRYQLHAQEAHTFVRTIEFDANMRVIAPKCEKERKQKVQSATLDRQPSREKESEREEEVQEMEEDRLQKQAPVLIRARVRQDHNAIKQALRAASGGTPESAEKTSKDCEIEVSARQGLEPLGLSKPLPASRSISDVSATTAEVTGNINTSLSLRASATFKASALPPLVEKVESAAAPMDSSVTFGASKPTYRIRERNKKDEREGEIAKPLSWKGSKGVLGRAAVEKRAAAAIRGDEVERALGLNETTHTDFPVPLVESVAEENQPTLSTQEFLSQEENPKGEYASITSWVPRYTGTKKKKKLILESLPEVPCGIFRGFEGQMQANVVLTQCFASLLRFLLISYANREAGFRHKVVDLAAETSLACAAIPKILEYFVEIVNTMYGEGFGDPADDQASQPIVSEDPTMVLTEQSASLCSVSSQMGRVVEAISELTLPPYEAEVGQDGTLIRTLPALNDEDEGNNASATSSKAVVSETNDSAKEDDAQKADEVEEIKKMLEERYRSPPAEVVIIALAMCTAHVEVREKERKASADWLEIWNDNSRNFKLAVLKGRNLSGL